MNRALKSLRISDKFCPLMKAALLIVGHAGCPIFSRHYRERVGFHGPKPAAIKILQKA